MAKYSITLGQFRDLTDELPDSATLTVNVNHGAAFVSDFRDVLDADVTFMSCEPYGEVILDCAPPEA